MCIVSLECWILQHPYVVIPLVLPFNLSDLKLVELDLGRSFSFFGLKIFNGFLGETIAVLIESFGSCEAALENVRSFTLLDLSLMVRSPFVELLS